MRLKHSLLVLAALAPAQALATNGYFSHGYGTINQGMAGAGTALAQDSIVAATNPAGMAFIDDRADVGAELFSPLREYSVEGGGPQSPQTFYLRPGTRESENEAFLIPHLGYNRQVTETQTLGLSVFANGGMNTEFSGQDMGTFGAGKAGVNLEQGFIAPTWTWRFAEEQAIGISPVIAYQRFSAEGLGSFAAMSSDPSALSDNGTDDAWGYGFQFGWQGQLTDELRGGLSWRKVLKMNEFDDYRGLFAEQGDFDIPQMFHAGLAWSGIEDHWLLLDVQHIRYSEINSVGNPFDPATRLGDDDGSGFGWDDMTVVKLGWQWQQDARQTWRAGVSYGEQPIPESEVLFNILAPGVQEWHITGGFTRELPSGLSLSGMAFYSPEETVRGENPMGPGQEIELSMSQLGAALSLGWQF
ncbi:outer membrane protein transport protein [Halomonas sp. LR5S13]|uniref:OmpP1/FadL family transporter n=1 Tax=Halomonas rhizosphaerae TaxID=3043296 RepID=UPI0024A7E186|nr:outer membrane protein transport protein [Halomonas rhizosphaerae]MDI5922441.1 outer membrane protein transport protein [Halomonas rhizosphaerae]